MSFDVLSFLIREYPVCLSSSKMAVGIATGDGDIEINSVYRDLTSDNHDSKSDF